MFEVQSGIARPGPKTTRGTPQRYPVENLQVGEYFIVPQTEMLEGDTPKTFRNRVQQSCRGYRAKVISKAHLEPGYNADTYLEPEFSVLTLGEPPVEHPDAWRAGDVGVWRDQ